MAIMSRIVIALCLVASACGSSDSISEPKPEAPEFTMCDYDIEGICVIEHSPHMDVDPSTLSWMLSTLEYEVQYHYPSFNLSNLAQKHSLDMQFKWAGRNTTDQGVYLERRTSIEVNLRRGDNIIPRMKCLDRYFVTAHEVLHFAAVRLEIEPDDVHNVPYIFRRWTSYNDLPHDQSVEGRMYTMIRRKCVQ